VLAETDARAIQQQLASLQTSYDLVVQLHDKQKSLWDQKIGTEVQYLQAKAQKESMEKQLAAVQEQIKMTRIVSPIDGTVDAVDVKLGQLTAPGMPAIRVVNFNNLKVKAELAETYASRVKRGDEVFITFPDLSDSVRAKVSYASRSINPLNRTFTVEVLLDNKKEYHPNMVTRLSINDYVSKTTTLSIPVNVITKSEDGTRYVYLAKGDKAVKRNVIIGKEYNGNCEVKEGLNEGDLLIVDGFDALNEGALIKVKK
jgi:RND family efflux transporter MFP subunit